MRGCTTWNLYDSTGNGYQSNEAEPFATSPAGPGNGDFAKAMSSWANGYNPDIIVVRFGFNDVLNHVIDSGSNPNNTWTNNDATSVTLKLYGLLSIIEDEYPQAQVLLCTAIPPYNHSPLEPAKSEQDDLEDGIADWNGNILPSILWLFPQVEGIVNIGAGFATNGSHHSPDGSHPNSNGSAKIAENIADAILGLP